MERYTRRDNVIISTLRESCYTEAGSSMITNDVQPTESSIVAEKTVFKLFNDTMSLDIDASDIAIAHRLKKGKRDVTHPIIVRLSNKRVRDKILHAKKSLRVVEGQTRIYISKHLTQCASALLFEARKYVRGHTKYKKITFAWTMNGRVYCKVKMEDPMGIMLKSYGDVLCLSQ